jgi:DNA-binding Lrp family transcriptional regulator
MFCPDALDLSLLRVLLEQPRVGMREYARLLGVARGTVQSRLTRLETAGLITSYAPTVDPGGLGYSVLAFVHLHLAQGNLDSVVAQVTEVPEVLEAHSTTGEGDLLCRVVGKDNAHLEQVVQRLLAVPGVVRTRTEIALNRRIELRTLPLLLDRMGARKRPAARRA